MSAVQQRSRTAFMKGKDFDSFQFKYINLFVTFVLGHRGQISPAQTGGVCVMSVKTTQREEDAGERTASEEK